MKILVPTDFSKLSKIAIDYALSLAREVNGEITLLHAVYIDAPPRAQAALKSGQILDAMVENAVNDFESMIKGLKRKNRKNIQVTYKIMKGQPVEEIVDTFAQDNKVDLIIMGTKGASGVKKVMMGSNASGVISVSGLPVMTIPEHARFKGIKHLLYASDMSAINKEIKTVIHFAKLFNSAIHILHIVPPGAKEKIDKTKIKNELAKKYDYSKINVHVSVNDDVKAAIDESIDDLKADILAMFTHKPTFFEKLFGQSVTREMAFHSWIPLLAIKK